MKSQFQIDNIAIEVIRKAIKNVHLSVHPPEGRVTRYSPEMTAPPTVAVVVKLI